MSGVFVKKDILFRMFFIPLHKITAPFSPFFKHWNRNHPELVGNKDEALDDHNLEVKSLITTRLHSIYHI